MQERPRFCGYSVLAALALVLAFAIWSGAASTNSFVIDRFTTPSAPDVLPRGWKTLKFPKIKVHTRYSVEGADGEYWLKAESRASASALYRELDLDPAEYPVLGWKWRVEGTVEGGDARKKEGDDYAARIYVFFEYEPTKTSYFERLKYKLVEVVYGVTPPGLAINYIWANRLARGEAIHNPYTDKVMMVALESGGARAGEWVSEERNVYDDYRRFFGRVPPRVTGIAVMADSDNTASHAVSYYDDLVFRKNP